MADAHNFDFDPIYRGAVTEFGAGRPGWSLDKPQPDIAALIDAGLVVGDVLDAGCGEAALSLDLAGRGYRTVGIDLSPTAIDLAISQARSRGLTTAQFAVADITTLHGYDGRFDTIIDSALFHSMPIARREGYVASMARAAAPGARFYVLAFDRSAMPDAPKASVAPVSADELAETVARGWVIDDVRPARHHCRLPDALPAHFASIDFRDEPDGLKSVAAWLLSAHRPQ
ncbi:SAM-dependent methyltransferase [Mycobacterium sp. MAA66]|uniref:class I SAM-dependent methyltransferase n=1 Tax=Mycobacterium sp. MAA66 TaxID=3156297 RepID=UPI0035111ACB